MTRLDRLLQRWRIAKAVPWLDGARRVLDVGCFRGELFEVLGASLELGIGLDPLLGAPVTRARYRLLPGSFPDDLDPSTAAFDAVTLLAVLEHVPPDQQSRLASACAAVLKPGGRLVATVPSPRVDAILDVLRRSGLVHGMSLEQHHGFDPETVPDLFAVSGFRLVHHGRFQIGLNHLYVLEAPNPVRGKA